MGADSLPAYVLPIITLYFVTEKQLMSAAEDSRESELTSRKRGESHRVDPG